jgi:hypothetical protein
MQRSNSCAFANDRTSKELNDGLRTAVSTGIYEPFLEN